MTGQEDEPAEPQDLCEIFAGNESARPAKPAGRRSDPIGDALHGRPFFTDDVRGSALSRLTQANLEARLAHDKRKYDGETDARRRAEYKREMKRTQAEINRRKNAGCAAATDKMAGPKNNFHRTKGLIAPPQTSTRVHPWGYQSTSATVPIQPVQQSTDFKR